MKRLMPRALHALATTSVPVVLISSLAFGLNSAVGIVRQAGEVQDRVAAVEHRGVEGADVALHQLDLVAHLGEAVVAEVELVEDADRLALVEQLADRDAADVARSAGDENHSCSS